MATEGAADLSSSLKTAHGATIRKKSRRSQSVHPRQRAVQSGMPQTESANASSSESGSKIAATVKHSLHITPALPAPIPELKSLANIPISYEYTQRGTRVQTTALENLLKLAPIQGGGQFTSIKAHTSTVVRLYDETFGQKPEMDHGFLTKSEFRLFLMLHDIGKGCSASGMSTLDQHKHTEAIIDLLKSHTEKLSTICGITPPIPAYKFDLMKILAKYNPVGDLLTTTKSHLTALEELKTMTSEMNAVLAAQHLPEVPMPDLYHQLILPFYCCDACSYAKNSMPAPWATHLFGIRKKSIPTMRPNENRFNLFWTPENTDKLKEFHRLNTILYGLRTWSTATSAIPDLDGINPMAADRLFPTDSDTQKNAFNHLQAEVETLLTTAHVTLTPSDPIHKLSVINFGANSSTATATVFKPLFVRNICGSEFTIEDVTTFQTACGRDYKSAERQYMRVGVKNSGISIQRLEYALEREHKKILFHLDLFDEATIRAIILQDESYAITIGSKRIHPVKTFVTAQELYHVIKNWDRFKDSVIFMRGGQAVCPPHLWLAHHRSLVEA